MVHIPSFPRTVRAPRHGGGVVAPADGLVPDGPALAVGLEPLEVHALAVEVAALADVRVEAGLALLLLVVLVADGGEGALGDGPRVGEVEGPGVGRVGGLN